MTQTIDQQVDAAIASQEPEVIETAAPEVASTETQTEPQAAEVEVDVPFPKKAINALSRRDKKIGQLQAERQQLLRELESLRASPQTQNKAKPDEEPSVDNFETFADYNRALVEYNAKKHSQDGIKQFQDQQRQIQQQAWIAEQDDAMSVEIERVIESDATAKQLLMENIDVVQSFTPELNMVAYQLQSAGINPVHGCLQLAKEGSLANLLSVPPQIAAAMIASASERAKSQPKPVTKAPAPINGVSGARASGSTLESKSPSELLKWMNS